MTSDEAHWLAGLLEGEGSFMKGPSSPPNLPIVKVEMCDEDVVRHAARLLKASITIIDRHPERGYKRVFRITVKGSRAVELMLGLRPLMGERRSRDIGSALATYKASKVVRKGRGGCLIRDCGRPSMGRGLCHRHYNIWLKRRGGKPDRPTLQTLDPGLLLSTTDRVGLIGSLVYWKAKACFEPARAVDRLRYAWN